MPLLRPTCAPSTYRVPTPPDSVTATWCQPPVGSAAVPSIRCSPPAPLVVIANRIGPEPLCGVTNMFVVVSVPKSKSRRHALVDDWFTHPAIVKSFSALTAPVGRATDWLVPFRATALPVRPAPNVGPLTSVAVWPPPDESAAVVPPVSSNLYQATGPDAAPSFSVIATWVVPESTTTVPLLALNVPPVTAATPTVRNCGSWTRTGPPGRVPDRVTVTTRCAAGFVTASDTPYVARAPELASNDEVTLLTPIVWPGTTQASGMPRPIHSGRENVKPLP